MADQTLDSRLESLLRDALAKEAASLPLRVSPQQIMERAALRRGARSGAGIGLRRLTMAVAAGAAAVAIVVAGAVGLNFFVNQQGAGAPSPSPSPSPTTEPSVDLGIFAPVAGRIIYYQDARDDLWALDPTGASPSTTLIRPGPDDQFALWTIPLGWSSDGTKLLFLRQDPTDQTFPYDRHLFILHADGTETQVTPEPVGGAAISPDGSRVVFAAEGDGLYVVDAEGGQPVRIADEGESPTFSPDGTQIAYLSESGQAGLEHVWVANADGADAHEILTDEALAMGMGKLTWSPAGDRIAMENQQEGHVAIYTFAPDGSDFTKVITGGLNHFWSPDGSQLAYGVPGRDGVSIADADGSNVRRLDFGSPGPWHPGSGPNIAMPDPTAEPMAPATTEPNPEPTASATPTTSPTELLSPEPDRATFTSAVHGISIDYPSTWQTRPATEPWTGEPLNFDSPAADVMFDPALGGRVYLSLASQPHGVSVQEFGQPNDWSDGIEEWLCGGIGGNFGTGTVDGERAWHRLCGDYQYATFAYTDTIGYFIWMSVPSDDPELFETFDWDFVDPLLETVDMLPEEALHASSTTKP